MKQSAGQQSGSRRNALQPEDGEQSGQCKRLGDMLNPPAGYVQMVRCGNCGHLAPTPLASLIGRFGADGETAEAMKRVSCSVCRKPGRAEPRLLRLCDPGCGRYRG